MRQGNKSRPKRKTDQKPVVRSLTIRDLPEHERPREKSSRNGIRSLSTVELLEVVLGRGIPGRSVIKIAQEMLVRFRDFDGISRASIDDLTSIRGIGLAKAVQIRACFEMTRRLDSERRPAGRGTAGLRALARAIRAALTDESKEHFMIVLLDSRERVTGISTVTVGLLDANLVHPREIFKEAIARNSASIILAHNHPSGTVKPSAEDLEITHRLVEAGELLGIRVLDHVIVTRKRHFSFRRNGIIKF